MYSVLRRTEYCLSVFGHATGITAARHGPVIIIHQDTPSRLPDYPSAGGGVIIQGYSYDSGVTGEDFKKIKVNNDG